MGSGKVAQHSVYLFIYLSVFSVRRSPREPGGPTNPSTGECYAGKSVPGLTPALPRGTCRTGERNHELVSPERSCVLGEKDVEEGGEGGEGGEGEEMVLDVN